MFNAGRDASGHSGRRDRRLVVDADAGLLGRREDLRLARLGQNQLTPYCSALVRSSSANLTRSRICFSIGGSPSCRLLTTFFAKGPASATARSPTSLLETMPLRRQRFARTLRNDLLIGESVLQDFAQRIQVQIHRHVIEGALSGLAPHHHGGVAQSLAVQQDLARGDRAGVDNVGIAGGDLADVGRDSR